jgi:DNA polymerase-2
VRGWILDLYPGGPGEVVVWLKREDGQAVRLVDHWSPSVFIAADSRADLGIPLQVLAQDIAWTRVVQKRERVTDPCDSEVVEVRLRDAKKAQRVAGRIERMSPFGAFRLYNVDVPPAQSYLYEHDLFPLAYCDVVQVGETLEWELLDDAWKCEYELPSFRRVKLDVSVARKEKLARLTDEIRWITFRDGEEGQVRFRERGRQDTRDGGRHPARRPRLCGDQ